MPDSTQTLSELQAEYQEKITKALANARTRLKTELDLAALTFDSMVKAGETAIWQSPTLAPILKSLGLQPAGAQPAKRGRKPRLGGGSEAGNGIRAKADGNMTGNGKMAQINLTKTEEKVLRFIAKGEKATQDIAKHIGTKNISPALSSMVKKGAIKARTEGVKKFWKRA